MTEYCTLKLLSSWSPRPMSQFQVPNPSPKSKIQSPEERDSLVSSYQPKLILTLHVTLSTPSLVISFFGLWRNLPLTNPPLWSNLFFWSLPLLKDWIDSSNFRLECFDDQLSWFNQPLWNVLNHAECYGSSQDPGQLMWTCSRSDLVAIFTVYIKLLLLLIAVMWMHFA